MRVAKIRAVFGQFAESRALSSDLSRATRATTAFMLPLIFLPRLHWPLAASFMALGAQNTSTIDVRGPYSLRVGLLLIVSFVFAGYAAVGALVSGQVLAAVLVTCALTLIAGIWRHLSSDYGASILIASLLMLFLGLAGPPGWATAKTNALSILAGCGLAIFLQILFWPFRPQQPLRQSVAESWLAAGNLFAALAPVPPANQEIRHEKVTEAESALRVTIDKTALFIIQASGRKSSRVLTQLEALNLCAARLALAVDSFNTALEGCMSAESWGRLAPAFDPVLTTLKNTARTVALTVVSRDSGHLATARIRLRRAEGLLRVFASQIQADPGLNAYRGQLEEIIQQIGNQLPQVIAALDQTVDRAGERSAFASELFDLNAWMLRPLAATLNLGQKPDAGLVRYVLRLAVLTMVGVAVYQSFHLPHGYWLPFTMVVILQPDFGATRQRAAQRVAGTVIGSVVATALLWFHPPQACVLTVIAIAAFGYAYILRRNYGTAIFFVTVFVILLLESGSAGQPHIALERVIATSVGSLLAFSAAAFFWPTWEREHFPEILAQAFRANANYLSHLMDALPVAQTEPEKFVEKEKRAVERAHAAVFASLRRMFGDPQNQREGIEQYAALANGNQRLTRILNVIFIHFQPGLGASLTGADFFCAGAKTFLNALADEIESRAIDPARLRELAKKLSASVPPSPAADAADADSRWLSFQCARAATELSALALIAEGDLRIRRPEPKD